MNIPVVSSLFRSRLQAFFAYVGLLVFGFVGNLFKYTLFFNVDVLFGSIFSMLALQLFGLRLGTAAAFLIACVTYVHWGHPYAILIMGLEVAFTGWLFQRKQLTLVSANTIYWVCVGVPLGFACYHWVMDLPWNTTAIMVTKQAVNGITNTLAARFLWFGWQAVRSIHRISMRDLLCHLMLLFALFPAFILVTLGARNEFDETDQQIRAGLRISIKHAAAQLESWLEDRTTAVTHLASLNGLSMPEMQARLMQAHATDGNFLRIGLHDKDAVIVAHSHPVSDTGQSMIGLSFAQRSYFPKIRKAREPILSEVYMSTTGIAQPLVSVLAPVLRNDVFSGFVIGVMSLGKIEHMLAQIVEADNLFYTLTDQNQRIILSNHPLQNRMAPLVHVDGPFEQVENGVVLHVLPSQPNRPVSQRWSSATYLAEMGIGQHAEWQLILEQPLAPFHEALSTRYAVALITLLGVVVLVLAFAEYLSRRLSATTEILSALTQDVATALESNEPRHIAWPESVLLESERLVAHFRKMFVDLQGYINVNRRLQMSLEARVVQRTQHLEEAQAIAHLGSWTWDIASGKNYWSNEQFRIFGFAPGAVIPSYDLFFAALVVQDRVPVRQAIAMALAGNAVYHVECQIERPDGTVRDILCQGEVIRDEHGKPTGMTGTILDTTERKESQRRLNALAASLEEKVRLRTQQLEELALQLTLTEERERNILAQELHDNHGQLLAILRIKLSQLGDKAEYAELVGLAEKAEQSARMVTRMLSPPSLAMTTLVQALQWLTQEIENSYGLTVYLTVEGKQPEISAVIKALLLRSVQELVVNVAKHAKVSSADLAYLGDEDQLRLVVGDDGCGFVPSEYTAILSSRHSFGLVSIMQRFAGLGGQVLIDSSPGMGTTVTLALPWAAAVHEQLPW